MTKKNTLTSASRYVFSKVNVILPLNLITYIQQKREIKDDETFFYNEFEEMKKVNSDSDINAKQLKSSKKKLKKSISKSKNSSK